MDELAAAAGGYAVGLQGNRRSFGVDLQHLGILRPGCCGDTVLEKGTDLATGATIGPLVGNTGRLVPVGCWNAPHFEHVEHGCWQSLTFQFRKRMSHGTDLRLAKDHP